jgi:hypothetical protein
MSCAEGSNWVLFLQAAIIYWSPSTTRNGGLTIADPAQDTGNGLAAATAKRPVNLAQFQ